MRSAVASYISPKAIKGAPSAIQGRGLVARARITKREVVAVKGGHIVESSTLRELSEHLQNSEIQIAEGLHVVALSDEEYEPVMLFINHSCDPNVGFAGNVVLVAMRDIDPGEELTVDYAMFDTSQDTMDCHCGSPACRRVVRGTDWELPDLQARYDGYFSWYLQRRIDG
jgi:SET domain-containing protein